jgi:hypothetical protein
MARRVRRNHTPAFKAKVALAAIKGGPIHSRCRPPGAGPTKLLKLLLDLASTLVCSDAATGWCRCREFDERRQWVGAEPCFRVHRK